MTANEGAPIEVGSNFGLEIAKVQRAADQTDQLSFIESIGQVVTELNEASPYVGRRVVIDVLEPIRLISLEDGSEELMRSTGDPVVCKLLGFYPEIEDTNGTLSVDLAVELDFEHSFFLSKFAALVRAEAIRNMELEDSSHPFVDEQRRFHQAIEAFGEVKAYYPTADFEDYLDEIVADIEASSQVMHADVELVVADTSTIGLRRLELLPFWVDVDEDEEAGEGVSFEDTLTNIDYRGTFQGRVVGYQHIHDDEGRIDLEIILALQPDNDVSEDPTYRYALMGAADISHGKLLAGPCCN